MDSQDHITPQRVTELIRMYLRGRLIYDPDWSEEEIANARVGRRNWLRKKISLLRKLRSQE